MRVENLAVTNGEWHSELRQSLMTPRGGKSPLKSPLLALVIVFVFAALILRLVLFAGRFTSRH